jgi:O-antigen ligase
MGQSGAGHERDLSRFGACLLEVCWFSFPVWLALATWNSFGQSNARYSVNGFWQWISLWGLAYAASSLSARPGMIRRFSVLTLAILAGVTIYGWMEYAWIQPAIRMELANNPIGMLESRGIAAGSADALLIKNRIESTEMRGLYALANSLAGTLVIAWTLYLGWAFSLWHPGRTTPTGPDAAQGVPPSRAMHRVQDRLEQAIPFLALAMVVLIGVALLLTKSRTAWIAAVVSTFGVLLLHPNVRNHARGWLRQNPFLIAAGACVLGSVALLVYWLDPLIIQEAGKSLAYRFDYWRGAWELIWQRPFLGYGPLNFQSTYLRVKIPTAAESPADPHNAPLEIAHAGGWPLLLIVGLVLALSAWLGWIRLRRSQNRLWTQDVDAGDGNGEFPSDRWNSSKRDWQGRVFWAGGILASVGVLIWSLFRASDAELAATCFGVLVSVALAIGWTRWHPGTKSIDAFLGSDLYVFGVAVGAFTIHLLASGGWMLPGTMTLPMVLFGWWTFDSVRWGAWPDGENSAEHNRQSTSRGLRLASAVFAVLFFAGWWWSMWSPLVGTLAKEDELARRMAMPTIEQIDAFIQTDPANPEIVRNAMEITVTQLEKPLSETVRRPWEASFLRLREEFIARDPGHSLAYSECGRANLRIAASVSAGENRNVWLERASDDFAAAARSYPASAQTQLQAALAAVLAGRSEDGFRFAESAANIDSATPHRDRKLKPAQVFWPRILVLEGTALDPTARQGTLKDYAKGEPVLEVLRSLHHP